MNIAAVIIVTVIVLILLFSLEKKLKQKVECQFCGGSGKIWEEAHDSADLQAANCSYCKGSGKIKQKPKGKALIRKSGRARGEKEMPIALTESALKKIKELMETNDPKLDPATTLLRIGVKGGGCSGFSYFLEFDGEITVNDKIFEFSFPEATDTEPKLKVLVDKKSYIYLNGTTLNYAAEGLEGGFKFNNPNAKSSCGCGQSFGA